ncbi:hypothetical protein ACVGW2_00145, partial [Enterobacter intestinihominis]
KKKKNNINTIAYLQKVNTPKKEHHKHLLILNRLQLLDLIPVENEAPEKKHLSLIHIFRYGPLETGE